MNNARDIYIERIKREIIGPGSDVFYCMEDYSDEIIEGKPLSRYYSGILFPPKVELSEYDIELINDKEDFNEEPKYFEENEIVDTDAESNTDEEESVKIQTNIYYPHYCGLNFCTPEEAAFVRLRIKFGTYKKISSKEVKIRYNGEGIGYLPKFGLDQYFEYNDDEKIISLKKELQGNRRRKQKSHDYLKLDSYFKNFSDEISKDHVLLIHLKKLVYGKDKWQRVDHTYVFNYDIVKSSKILLKDIIKSDDDFTKGITLYSKIYYDNSNRSKYVRILLENSINVIQERKYLPTNEKLNESCMFQVEMQIYTEKFLPFDNFGGEKFITEEDRNLDFLYSDVKSYGIGSGVACEWDFSDNPAWIKTAFLPHYDIKKQSTAFRSEDIEIKDILKIKNLSGFSQVRKDYIIPRLHKFNQTYFNWINEKSQRNKTLKNHELGSENLLKCVNLYNRIKNGIEILEKDEKAFAAFQFMNSAMYMQMFHSAKYFGNGWNKGFDLFEWKERFHQNSIPKYSDYKIIDFPAKDVPVWRPFQIGFILLSLASIVNPNSDDRNLVDLIWFPTGGGKTEAYLAVTVFLIFYRRLANKRLSGGVNAIIRYTLRLLTMQQFERASKIILACEKIRRENKTLLGDEEISIGFWVGAKTIPNKVKDAENSLNKIKESLNKGKLIHNVFPINNCQWCNTKIINKINKSDKNYKIGIRANFLQQGIKAYCNNPECDFSEDKKGFPIVLIDEDIYNKPPTVLFGTVDKFAMLAWQEAGGKLFNRENDYLPPELIIQDELHLISGPLGSLTGLFENVIKSLCEKNGITPKIIASTATTKNVENQVKRLYGKKVSVFPWFALDTKDNFFSHTETDSVRRYIGIMPTGKNYTMAQLKILASMLYARIEIWKHKGDEIRQASDNFWTVISYFNSLKEVGKMANKIGSELRDGFLKQIHSRMLDFNVENFRRLKYAQELTSRIPNERIKDTLDKLSIQFENDIKTSKAIDLVLATNMISVGLDVERLGIMLVNGMPRNISEYIQATSRVARKKKGVIFVLLNPDNSRDLSYFEHFVSFHQKFYKEIEPLSLTPFTENTLDRMLLTAVVTFFRHKIGKNRNENAANINEDLLFQEFNKIFENHLGITEEEKTEIKLKLEKIIIYWKNRIGVGNDNNYKLKFKSNKKEESFLKTIDEINNDEMATMQSVRSVEPSVEIKINQY